MSMDKQTILVELAQLLRDRDNRHKRMLAFFASILEENEDMLYGLFWDEYNRTLPAPESQRRFVGGWCMEIFEGIVQKVTPRAVRFAGSLLLDPYYPARDYVAEFLGEMGSPDAYKYLVSVVLDEEDYQIASRAARSLGQIGAVQAEPLLIDIMNGKTHAGMTADDRDIIQFYALQGLQWLDTPTAREAIELVAVQRDFDEISRSNAVRFLVRKKGVAVIPLLRQLVSDESKDVQHTATFYLKELEGNN